MPTGGLIPAINREEVEVALKGMKNGKAIGPDGIPVEVWKRLVYVVGSAPEYFRAG